MKTSSPDGYVAQSLLKNIQQFLDVIQDANMRAERHKTNNIKQNAHTEDFIEELWKH